MKRTTLMGLLKSALWASCLGLLLTPSSWAQRPLTIKAIKLSPDGEKLAMVANPDRSQRFDVLVLDLKGQTSCNITAKIPRHLRPDYFQLQFYQDSEHFSVLVGQGQWWTQDLLLFDLHSFKTRRLLYPAVPPATTFVSPQLSLSVTSDQHYRIIQLQQGDEEAGELKIFRQGSEDDTLVFTTRTAPLTPGKQYATSLLTSDQKTLLYVGGELGQPFELRAYQIEGHVLTTLIDRWGTIYWERIQKLLFPDEKEDDALSLEELKNHHSK